MPLWLFIFLIVIAAIAGSVIGSFAVIAWALYVLHNYKGSRQRR
jgi:hypothetical protein